MNFGGWIMILIARLAQSAERKALNLVVVGSSPTVGVLWGKRKVAASLGRHPKLSKLAPLCNETPARGKVTPAGLEPAIPGSVGRCLIHLATGPGENHTWAQKPTILGQPWGLDPRFLILGV